MTYSQTGPKNSEVLNQDTLSIIKPTCSSGPPYKHSTPLTIFVSQVISEYYSYTR